MTLAAPDRGGWLDMPAAEAERGLAAWLQRARAAGDTTAVAHGLLWLGRVRAPQGQAAAAEEALAEAHRLALGLGDAALQAQVDIAQAWNDAEAGQHARALSACRRVGEAARGRGDEPAWRQAHFVAATSLVHLGEHDQAVDHFEQARVALLASPGRLPPPAVRHRHGRYAAGLAQAWLMRAGLLLEAGGRQAAAEAFERARQHAEQACEDLADALPRLSAPALFSLQRVLLEAGEPATARAWTGRLATAAPAPAPAGSLALAQQVLGRAMLDLRDGAGASVLGDLQVLAGVAHPRVVAGDLRLAWLRCLFEACEADGRYAEALDHQHQWAELKARLRGRLAAEHGQWTATTLAAWKKEAEDVVTLAFREPLRTAVARLEAAPAADAGGADTRPALDRARHSIARAIDIADQYLGVMRAEHLRREDMRPLDLAALAHDVCEQMAPPAGAPVRLVRAIAPGLRVLGDRVLLMRALGNLLSNAFKHAPAGSAVALSLAAQGRELRLRVADEGPGMPLDMRARLFQRFATGAVRKGNGLGLAMVSRVARLHGARIEVDSEPGQGTAVSLLLEADDAG